jgi:hypothetical protein
MPDTNDKPKPKRAPVKRLTPAEKRDKAIASIDAELAKAADAILKATQGAFLARDMARATKLMGVCQALMEADIVQPEDAAKVGLA